MTYFSPQSDNTSKPKLLGTLDTNKDLICHNHISSIYPTCRDQVREAIRTRHYNRHTEDCYVNWIQGVK